MIIDRKHLPKSPVRTRVGPLLLPFFPHKCLLFFITSLSSCHHIKGPFLTPPCRVIVGWSLANKGLTGLESFFFRLPQVSFSAPFHGVPIGSGRAKKASFVHLFFAIHTLKYLKYSPFTRLLTVNDISSWHAPWAGISPRTLLVRPYAPFLSVCLCPQGVCFLATMWGELIFLELFSRKISCCLPIVASFGEVVAARSAHAGLYDAT